MSTVYTVTLQIITDARTDSQLRTTRRIEHELRSWIESLNAQVIAITVKEQP